MEIKIKMLNKSLKLRMLFILTFAGYTFTDQIPNVTNTDKAKAINQKEIVTVVNAKILNNSSVILNSDGSFSNFDKVTGVTSNLDILSPPSDPRELVYKPFDDKKVTSFKLVEVPGKKNMVSDGGFIVEFKNISDKEQFNIDFSLVSKFESSNRSIYFSKGFNGLDVLIKDMRSDSRVLSVELNLIDPNIKSQ